MARQHEPRKKIIARCPSCLLVVKEGEETVDRDIIYHAECHRRMKRMIEEWNADVRADR